MSSSSFLGFFFASWPKQMNCYLVWDVQMPCLPHSTLGNEGDGFMVETIFTQCKVVWALIGWCQSDWRGVLANFLKKVFYFLPPFPSRELLPPPNHQRSMIVPGCKGWHLRIDMWKHRNFRNSLRNCEWLKNRTHVHQAFLIYLFSSKSGRIILGTFKIPCTSAGQI